MANHNQWCVGVFRYFFAAVHWTRSELVQLDWRTRKVLVQNKCHHSGAAVERLYLPRSEGGRGLQNLLQIWEREVVSTASYLLHSEDPQVQGAVELQEEMGAMGRCSFLDQARQIVERHGCDIELAVTHPKTCSGEVKKHQQEAVTTRLLEKTVHGVHAQQTREKGCDRRATVKWLQERKLQPATEALLVAAQDGVTHTLVYRQKILKQNVNTTCRRCGDAPESLGHILAACKTTHFSLIKLRHDKVLYCLTSEIIKALGMEVPNRLRAKEGGAAPGVYTRNRITVDQLVCTARPCSHRRPDLLIRQAKERRIIIMEVACAWDPLVSAREKEQADKYDRLAADLAQHWGYRVIVASIVIGDLGTIVGLRRNLTKACLLTAEQISNMMAGLQRETLCGAVHIIKRHCVGRTLTLVLP